MMELTEQYNMADIDLPKTFIWQILRKNNIFNRPGVAGAVLQTPLQLIHSLIYLLSHTLVQNIQDTFTPKPQELGT